MYNNVILTVGTSFFSAFNLFGKEARNCEGLLFEKGQLYIENLAEEQTIWSTWQQKVTEHLNDVSFNESISAEFSVLTLLHHQQQLNDLARIYLFYTDTVAGRFAAYSLKQLIAHVFHKDVYLKKIENLDIKEEQQLNASMGKFIIDIHELLSDCGPHTTCFAPIGGYKIMISYAYVAAAIHQMHIMYLPESGDVLHSIPPVPVTFDTSDEQLIDVVTSFDQQLVKKYDSVTRETQQVFHQYPSYFDIKENEVYLNPIGQYLRYRMNKRSAEK